MKPQYLTINMKANKLYYYFFFFATVNSTSQDYSVDGNLECDNHLNKSY